MKLKFNDVIGGYFNQVIQCESDLANLESDEVVRSIGRGNTGGCSKVFYVQLRYNVRMLFHLKKSFFCLELYPTHAYENSSILSNVVVTTIVQKLLVLDQIAETKFSNQKLPSNGSCFIVENMFPRVYQNFLSNYFFSKKKNFR